MDKFKVGDRVKRVGPSDILEVGEVYTVEYVGNSGIIRVFGCDPNFDAECFELVIDNETIRKQITDAVNMLEHFKIWVNKHGNINNHSQYTGEPLSEFLDKYYPLKTQQQLEIESIRKEQEKLAARLKELEG